MSISILFVRITFQLRLLTLIEMVFSHFSLQIFRLLHALIGLQIEHLKLFFFLSFCEQVGKTTQNYLRLCLLCKKHINLCVFLAITRYGQQIRMIKFRQFIPAIIKRMHLNYIIKCGVHFTMLYFFFNCFSTNHLYVFFFHLKLTIIICLSLQNN